MFKFIKKIKRMLNEFDNVKLSIEEAINNSELAIEKAELARKYIKRATTVNADLSPLGHDPNIIFIAGRYKNTDYVQCYSINSKEFSHIVDELQSMKKFARIARIDAPKGFEIAIKRELENKGE
jgi:hypothetical protein